MSTVIARSRQRMYTAFVTADGRRVLNIATTVEGAQRCVSIEIPDHEVIAVAADDQSAIERLLSHGHRLPETLPTPSAGVPVTELARAA